MRVLGTEFNLKQNALEIYVSGCSRNPHCEDCHNPESWDYSNGELFSNLKFKLKNKITRYNDNIKKFWILGGEPLDNPDLTELVKFLKKFDKELWLFTSYKLQKTRNISRYFDYIKTGRYIKDLGTEDNIQYGVKLTTSNQNIYKKDKDY